MPSIASSSPEVLIATAAANTSRIRVGSGGVMLPNHVPLRVVETYRTLNGPQSRPHRPRHRPGRRQRRADAAARCARWAGEYFSEELAELLAFEQDDFPHDHPFEPVRVAPERVGAAADLAARLERRQRRQAAGQLGRRLFLRRPFQPDPAAPGLRGLPRGVPPVRRSSPSRTPSSRVSALVAPTDEEAQFLSALAGAELGAVPLGRDPQARARPRRRPRTPTPRSERRIIDKQCRSGSSARPQTVKAEIERKAAEAGADEVMVTTTMYSHELRLRSFRLLAEAFGL